MAKGGFGGYGGMGGMNMNNLMKQAQKMQKQMADAQKELEEKEFEITSGGGAVKVIISGNKTVKKIEISEDVVDPDDVEMLEDLVLTAVNEAIRTVEEAAAGNMSKITGVGGIPGLF
ncbi:MAG: YbaB/EbfC family nucleoid-associated protein [Eubacterium sp.]|nr:YbaB/EbfC family nucleoid-associated protein [Eubacterium sp.]MCD7855580.1 YbaB/EbfC family nucleoid-associated protein [Clostridiales bacterium]